MGDTLVMENGITFLDISKKIESFGKALLETARTILSRRGPIEAIRKVYHAQLMKLRKFLGIEDNNVSEIEPIPVPVSETVAEMESVVPIAPPVEIEPSNGVVRVKDSEHKRVSAKGVLVESMRKGLLTVDINPILGKSNTNVETAFVKAPETPDVAELPEEAPAFDNTLVTHDVAGLPEEVPSAVVLADDNKEVEKTFSLGEPVLYNVPETTDLGALEQLPKEVIADVTPTDETVKEASLVGEPTFAQVKESKTEDEVKLPEGIAFAAPAHEVEVPSVDLNPIVLEHTTEDLNEVSAAGPKSPTEVGAVIGKIAEMLEDNRNMEATNVQLTQKVEILSKSDSEKTERIRELEYENTVLARKAQLLDEKLAKQDGEYDEKFNVVNAELAKKDSIISELRVKAEESETQRQRADEAEAKINGIVVKLADMARIKPSGYEKAA